MDRRRSNSSKFVACWPSFSRSAFTGWREIIKLGAPGAISLACEWGAWEYCASIAGRLGNAELAAHSIFMTTVQLWYSVPLGLSQSVAALIGNFLGAQNPAAAARTAKIGVFICSIYGCVNSFLFTVILRYHWGSLFTSDSRVLSIVESTIPILLLYGFADSVKCSLMAILRGCGRPILTVWGNFFSCLLVQFPIAYALIDGAGLELLGLWIAMSLAWVVALLIYLTVLIRTDWSAQVREALERNSRSIGGIKSVAPAEEENEIQMEKISMKNDSIDQTSESLLMESERESEREIQFPIEIDEI